MYVQARDMCEWKAFLYRHSTEDFISDSQTDTNKHLISLLGTVRLLN